MYMKLISLNTWGGKIYRPLMNFVQQHSQSTDIFCFQEVFHTPTKNFEYAGYRLNLYDELASILKDFQGFYAPTQNHYVFFEGFVAFNLSFGLTIFVKKDIKIKSSGDFFVYREENSFIEKDLTSLPRNLQYLNLDLNGKNYWVCNIHGIWVPGPKIDNPSRIEQSKKILDFLNKKNGGKILCGDFNLNIDTKSLKILEENMKNLIKEYRISATRSKLYTWGNKFADYTFVSKEVTVKSFTVPDVEISDHLPMILKFD